MQFWRVVQLKFSFIKSRLFINPLDKTYWIFGLNKTFILSIYYYICDVATRKFKIPYVAVIFVLYNADPEQF